MQLNTPPITPETKKLGVNKEKQKNKKHRKNGKTQ
jgi:hypothetical protein